MGFMDKIKASYQESQSGSSAAAAAVQQACDEGATFAALEGAISAGESIVIVFPNRIERRKVKGGAPEVVLLRAVDGVRVKDRWKAACSVYVTTGGKELEYTFWKPKHSAAMHSAVMAALGD